MINIRIHIILAALMIMGGCTVATHDLRDELEANSMPADCNLTFSLQLNSSTHTNSLGESPHKKEALAKLEKKYISSTAEALENIGCKSKHASQNDKANLSINVSRQLYLSALPQEYLTGLSLGLIPSWGTRPDQYIYTFTNLNNGKTHSYHVDQNSYLYLHINNFLSLV